ncbi:hypothetical protein NDU88_008049 [Pleurodeles waltl]|uniref:Uncharacterized protein n=1 Tax=Pleurodeles waltl TaxID=8319 RepID=A0AAV7PN70_PLEWA|nr:hypothetical protein NDU88_008049 [Pleurodeles waltl]
MAEHKDHKEKDGQGSLKRSKREPPLPKSPVTDKQENPTTLESILKKLNDAHDIAQSMTTNTDIVQVEVSGIRRHLEEFYLRVTNAQGRIGMTEDHIAAQSKPLCKNDPMLTFLRRKIAEQEDRNGRAKLRIFGLPECSEDKAPSAIAFLESWIPMTLGISLSKDFEIDHAHWAPTFTPKTAMSPRALIFEPQRNQYNILAHMRKIKPLS